ncbi:MULTISPECIES: hypothetical protein [unclassified Endozoicomonas]|uniref:hypothetical protein n=1 Tax=unclassified Endozoicomonas TaxID=2644528 RepID=UPI0021497837|nr:MULTISPECIES: hypothetical protein [unclassified Endozoicomonas]
MLLLLLPLLSVVCQAKPCTKRFTIELEQKANCPTNQSISIKQRGPHRFSDAVNTIGFAGQPSSPDQKPLRPGGYGIKTILIGSILWQWLYATQLLVGFELILTIKGAPLYSKPYSCVRLKAVVAVCWLLKNAWNQGSSRFNPIEQEEARSQLTRGYHPFAITTIMLGSGDNLPQYPPSESSGQQLPAANNYSACYFAHLLYSDSDDGNENPQQYLHTLDLNCFVHPCSGVCQFRPSFDSGESIEWPPITAQSSCPHLTDGYCFSCISRSEPEGAIDSSLFETLDRLPDIQLQCDSAPQFTPQPHGKVYKNINALTDHKDRYHRRQQICNVIVVGEDGQQHLCGEVCKNSKALADHKSRYHSGQQTCDVIVVGKDGQQQPCGKICKNIKALSTHKSGEHSGQKTCDVTVIGEDGQQRPCGKVCKNAQSLSSHKSSYHSGQKNCDVMVDEEDGQQRPCGKVCKNARFLVDHKRSVHSGQKTCDETLVGEDGQLRPCSRICKNAQALSYHKFRQHRRQQTCDMTLFSDDSQPRPCRTVYKSAAVLSGHKRKHQKNKPDDLNLNDHLSPKKVK